MRLAFVLMLAGALPLAAQAREPGEPGMFCLDRSELAAGRKNAGDAARQMIYSDKSTFGPLIAGYEKTLDAAARGDAGAQRRIGGFWAACILAGDAMSEAKQASAAQYLNRAAESGDKQAMRYLVQFHALGAGVSADYAKAYHWLLATDFPADAAGKRANALGIAHATPAEQQAFMVFAEVLRALLQQRLQQLVPEVVREDTAGQLQSLRVVFYTCPNRAEILQADAGINRDVLLPALQALVQRLASSGLPCNDDNGKPLAMQFPATIKR